MHRVVVLALDQVVPFELGIAARIFGAANPVTGAPLYAVSTCSVDGGPVRTAADYTITVEHDATALETADTVVIPPSHPVEAVCADGKLVPSISAALARVRPGARLVSICSGTFVLAAAGLLDGRPATTHWRKTDELQQLFPLITVDPEVLFVDDGDVLTSAGVAAGVDLCLHLVRKDHGSEVANWAARRCVVPPWRDGGQAQFIPQPVPAASGISTSAARQWALERLDQPVVLAELAKHAGMSLRTFTRRFREEAGVSPGQWLTLQRIDRARHLLESTDLSIDQVAAMAGFGTATSLRQHLHRAVGVSPAAYRRTFRTTSRS